eukprot:6123444-Amphidinium_carterae.1
MVLLDVDDLILACSPTDAEQFKKDIEVRFELGKYEKDRSSFCGRRLACTPECIEVDMEKYIVEEEDMKRLQSADQRCGIASMLAARLKDCTTQDVITANKAVQYLKSTKDVKLKLWRIPWNRLHLVTHSDAGGVLTKEVGVWHEGSGPTDSTQGAWLIFATDGLPKTEELVRLSPLMWKSSKLKRKVPSTLAGEALALSEAVASVEWSQMMLRDVKSNNLLGDLNWERSCGPFAMTMSPQCALADRLPQGHTIDAKAVFDALQREAAGSKADRRAAVDLSLIHAVVERTNAVIRWVPHSMMLADPLTKLDVGGHHALTEALRTGHYRFIEMSAELTRRSENPALKARTQVRTKGHGTVHEVEEEKVGEA